MMKFIYTKDNCIFYKFKFTKILLKTNKNADEILIKVGEYIISLTMYTPQLYLFKNKLEDIEKYFGEFRFIKIQVRVIKYPWHNYFSTKNYN